MHGDWSFLADFSRRILSIDGHVCATPPARRVGLEAEGFNWLMAKNAPLGAISSERGHPET